MNLRLQGKWMIAAGAVWIASAVAIPLFAMEARGASQPVSRGVIDFIFPFDFTFSYMEAGLSFMQFLAVLAASAFCLLVGIGLCSFGFVPKIETSSTDGEAST